MRGPITDQTPVRGYKLPPDLAAKFTPARHRVVVQFCDAEGHVHPPGEEWTLKEALFVPYDDELLVIIALDDKPGFYVIPLTYRYPEQADVIESFSKYAMSIQPRSISN